MTTEDIRAFCLSLPQATESLQWGNDLVFKIGGKMFAVAELTEADRGRVSFKCDATNFAQLLEREGVVPAPYMARAQWVSVEDDSALSDDELEERLKAAYEIIKNKLPKKARIELGLDD